MQTLHNLLENEIQEQFSFPNVGIKIIQRKLENKGVFLADKQLAEVEKKLRDIRGDTLNINLYLEDNQKKALGVSDKEIFEVDFTASEQELDEIYDEVIAKLEISYPELISKAGSIILSSLRKNAPRMLKEHRKIQKGFEHRLNNDYKKPFDLYEMFLVIAYEAGDEVNKECRKEESERDKFLVEVLTRLHARACQIASEILVLIESGYADGAHARWRSLHEIAVVGAFIQANGNEIAEKYLLHDNIESYRAANLYEKYYKTLGDTPIPQEEFDSIKAVYEELIIRFGKPYKNNYGWASSALRIDDPTFSDIEKQISLDYHRPYYKLASYNVHASSKGIFFKLGQIPNTRNNLLAGASNIGFTEPAQSAVISLGHITRILLTFKPTIDNVAISKILSKLESEIGEEFFNVQQEIERREAAYQRKHHTATLPKMA
jgi:hypothetical protein